MTSIGKKMANGVRWSILDKGGQQGITFIVFAILARYIVAEDFGLVAMALIIIGFIQLFIDQGFSTAIIQKEDINNDFLSTAFWSNIAVGIILGGLLFALKDVTASFFKEPRVAELIPWMALALLFEALMSVQQALLKRQFNFKALALRTLLARLIAGSIAIFGAMSGWGVWSLVSFTVLSAAFSTVILWWVSDWYPNLRFSAQCFKALINFGGNVTGVRLMTYASSRVLDVIIGYFFGAVALGYYTLAYQLVGRIGAVLVQILSQVTMSGFSRVQASAEMLLNHLLKVTHLTTAMVFPLFALLGLMADDVVYLLYGDNWEQSAKLISFLAPIGPAMVMSSTLGNAVMSAGEPNLILRARTLATMLLIMSLVAIQFIGLEILVLAFTASFYTLTLPLYFIVAKRVIPLHFRTYVMQLIPVMLATTTLILTVSVIQNYCKNEIFSLIEMILTMTAGSIAYMFILLVFDRKILGDIRRLMLDVAS